MQILIQKFGGTSVQGEKSRGLVVNHVKDALKKNYKVIVVVSALGRKPNPYATDTLLSLVDYPKSYHSKRELDLLMSCGEIISSVVLSSELQREHIRSIALTGAQAGIVTSNDFNQARIKSVRPIKILSELKLYDVVVVAGFQGQTENGETTTIGRGGSDTTAAALGAAFTAKRIEIFTDVNGIMTADPSIVETARPLDVVTYTEISNLAYQGAKVVHPRAIEIAMQAKVPIRVRSTYSEKLGTLVTSDADVNSEVSLDISERLITGIAHMNGITQIKVSMGEDALRLQSDVFRSMASVGISVDFINISPSDVIYTIPSHLIDQAISILKTLKLQPEITKDCAKVSVVGSAMSGVPGVASKIVQALTSKGVRILQTADSHTTIWVLVRESDVKIAVNALHDVFELGTFKANNK